MIEQVFGPYRIVSKLGAGGMGEVYRARDTNLERDVAIKVLPEMWAGDPERLARFRREAQVLASLNHPHIAQIYGVERGAANAKPAGATGLVMELVDGPTLADRIAEGPLPLEEAVAIARQIAEALEAAHEHGIVHRDLKPANVKVREDGTVKVLDFGLAKMTAPAVAGSASAATSPTLTSPAVSQLGTILGTAAYMSPEQARGKAVDKRTDIWAFGCVLFEMLSGRRPFDGEDMTEILASVVKTEPAWPLVPPTVPPRLVRLISHCLEKNPRHRLRDIGDAQFDLAADPQEPAPIAAPPRNVWRERTLWFGAIVVVGALGAGAWVLRGGGTVTSGHVTRFALVLPEGQRFNTGVRRLAISPDGNVIVYTANNQLYRRVLSDLEPQVIAGTNESPTIPEFSPDGRSIIYSTFDSATNAWVVKRIPENGGTAITITQIGFPREQGGWIPGDVTMAWVGEHIVGSRASGIWTVPAGGGEPRMLVTVDPAVEVALWPRLIDRGRHLLYTVRRVDQTGPDAFSIVVQPVDGGIRRVLVPAGRLALPLPTGHLAYLRGTDLMAVQFDEARQAVSGEPVVVASDMSSQIAISPAGTLVHIPPAGLATRTAVWVNRAGIEEPIGIPPQPMSLLRLSPDGNRLTFSSGTEIRVWTFAKATITRLREEEGGQWDAAWMPDGNRLLFSAGRAVASNRIVMKAADGSGPTTTVIASAVGFPNDVSTDSKLLLYHRGVGELMLYVLDGSAPPRQIVKGRSLNGVFSPDGRWIAYQSTESHRMEIFVRAFPDVEAGRWQVSTGGARFPVWSPDGGELFFVSDSGHLTAVKVDSKTGFATGAPVQLFRTDAYAADSNSRPYDISPDGKRFVFPKPTNEGRPTIYVVTNWLQEVTAKVGAQ